MTKMTQEQYIASRTPVVQAVAILAIFLVLAIVTAMATGDDDAILGVLFLGAPVAIWGPAAAMVKKRQVVLALVLAGLLLVPGVVQIMILARLFFFSDNLDRGIGELPKWWLTTGMISTCAVYVPLVAIGILGWRNYIRAHRRNT